MNKIDLKKKAAMDGEYVYGSDDTGSHACYMIYGILRPGENNRKVKPGRGHEEMLLAVSGSLDITGVFEGVLEEGSAIHLAGEQSCFLENRGAGDVVYVIAGGHSEEGHHH